MSTDRDAFLRAIADTPDDDAPRLVFADWLDEHGEPARAEFIRVQCAAEAFPEGHPNRDRLQDRARVLLREHSTAWMADLPEPVHDPIFARGFLDRVAVDADGLSDSLPALTGILPAVRLDVSDWWVDPARTVSQLSGVRRLSLTYNGHRDEHAEPALPTLLRLPSSSGLAELDLSEMSERSSLATLAAWPGLANLRLLGINFHRTGTVQLPQALQGLRSPPLRSLIIRTPAEASAEIVRQLVSWPGFAHLRQLTFSDLSTPALRLLTESRSSVGLLDLSISGNLSAEVCLRLLESPALPRLRDVWINGDPLTPNRVAPPALTDTENGPRLLSLRRVKLDEEDATRLVNLPRWRNLSVLRLCNCQLSGSMLALASSPTMPALRALDLGDNSLDTASLRALAGSVSFPALSVLDLSGNELDAPGLRALARTTWAKTIKELRLARCRLNDAAVRALAGVPFQNLRSLTVNGGRGGNQHWAGLATASWLAGLEELHLRESGLADASLSVLADTLGDRLHTLDVSRNWSTTAKGLRALFGRPLRGLSLRVGRFGLEVDEARELARWPGLANLRELHLSLDHTAPEVLAILAGSPHWNGETTVTVGRDRVNDEHIEALRRRVRVVWQHRQGNV